MSGDRAASPLHTNRLAGELSPYLLQHAHNPVDWYPWGPEALQRARAEDQPILLSIGYAACHWCHVMERESFEDEATAAFMNQHYVCIKVDREERPDLDAIYMDAVQLLTGQGGWPMTVFLTPEGVPFHAGTYFPPVRRGGMPAFLDVLGAVSEAWEAQRDDIRRQSEGVLQRLRSMAALAPQAAGGNGALPSGMLERVVGELERRFDKTYGGFGQAPKFPQAPLMELLVRAAARGSECAREMAEFTLRSMAHAGIYDQVGGGFHRYAVDRAWVVPHFEKMLYDNAQLARLYTHAWQAWNLPCYRRVALETLAYLLRDLRDPAGGFASSEDADSPVAGHPGPMEEGAFYVWDYDAFMEAAPEAAAFFRVSRQGNFEGHNILVASSDHPPEEARAKLLDTRSHRPRPPLDGKVLTSWNGLAIAALAEAGAAFDRPDLVGAAKEAAAFLLATSRTGEGRLLHTYKDGTAGVLGMLEDYAYLADGLLALWDATFEATWYEAARALASQMVELFWDPEAGGFFSTGTDHEALLVRQKELVESVTPGPAAVAISVLQRLALLTGDAALGDRATEALRQAAGLMEQSPVAAPTMLAALDYQESHPKEIVIVGAGEAAAAPLLRAIWDRYLPNRVLAGAPLSGQPAIDSPLLEGKAAKGGAPTAFVCEGYACRAPTTDAAKLGQQLDA